MYQIVNNQKLILASSSPRRKELIKLLGIEPIIIPAAINEDIIKSETAIIAVQRLAAEKALAVSMSYRDSWVLGVDTLVAIDQIIFSKPDTRAQAMETLQNLSGKTHQVHSGIALVNYSKNLKEVYLSTTAVTFSALAEAQILAYVNTGEADDKAGAYGIQGLAGSFVSSINGSYTNVVGLDLNLTSKILFDHQIIQYK